MKSRNRRAKGATPRKNVIPIRLDDDEYTSIIDAAYKKNVTPSTFLAEAALREAARINKKT